MAYFLGIDEDENYRKMNIDDLYEKQKQKDLKQVNIFNKILNRIHTRITVTNRTKPADKYVWFNVPEYIFGEPVYDKGECLGYVIAKLEENGFYIRYVHPNTLFISWQNWVPTYVRNEIKKKRGIILDEKGNVVEVVGDNEDGDMTSKLLNDSRNPDANKKPQKQYTPIDNYKPTGNLVYNKDLFEKLEKKVVFDPYTTKNK